VYHYTEAYFKFTFRLLFHISQFTRRLTMNNPDRTLFHLSYRTRLWLVVLLVLVLMSPPPYPAKASPINVTALTSGFTPTNNNYTLLRDALAAALSGDTITLSGNFDWTETNAANSWALGNDGVVSAADDYSLLVPAGLNSITLTAASLGAATIQGPGDLAAVNLEGFLVFDGGDNQSWIISNLQIYDFDLGIGMFNGAGGVDAFNNTTITNNRIRIPTDLNSVVAPADVNQNIGIHFSFGANQKIQGNTLELAGNGVSSGANFASSVGMQSNTSGGSVYDGLVIDNNTLRVLNAQSANPENILGIWENGHAHSSNITVSNNQFLNQAAGNNPATNLQRAFRVTSHSGASTTVTYADNTVNGANTGFQWLAGSNFAGNQPVRLWRNTLTNCDTGILVQSNGLANLYRNNISGSGSGGGVHVITGQLAAAGPVTNAVQENFIRNGSVGLLIDATAGAIGPIFNNDLSGNSGFALNNGPVSLVIADANWWGSSTPAIVAGEISGNVDFTPFLRIGTDTQPGITGFQGDFADHLTFDQQPTDTLIGQVISPAVTIQVIDVFSNLLTTDSSNVTLAIETNPGSGVLSGTLTTSTVGGIATFNNLSINRPGSGYTLAASHDVLISPPSATFSISGTLLSLPIIRKD
jgi:hypothetical protein